MMRSIGQLASLSSAPTKARLMVISGIGLLVLATVIIGYGNYIGR